MVRPKGYVYKNGKYVEEYTGPGYESTKSGIVSEPESDVLGKSDWKEWHKSKYPSKYKK